MCVCACALECIKYDCAYACASACACVRLSNGALQKELQKEQKALSASWRPIVFRVTEVHLLHRRDGNFVTRATVRLRHQGGEEGEGDDE